VRAGNRVSGFGGRVSLEESGSLGLCLQRHFQSAQELMAPLYQVWQLRRPFDQAKPLCKQGECLHLTKTPFCDSEKLQILFTISPSVSFGNICRNGYRSTIELRCDLVSMLLAKFCRQVVSLFRQIHCNLPDNQVLKRFEGHDCERVLGPFEVVKRRNETFKFRYSTGGPGTRSPIPATRYPMFPSHG
jgi:hypothetical protein